MPTLQAGVTAYIVYPGLSTWAIMLRPFRAFRPPLGRPNNLNPNYERSLQALKGPPLGCPKQSQSQTLCLLWSPASPSIPIYNYARGEIGVIGVIEASNHRNAQSFSLIQPRDWVIGKKATIWGIRAKSKIVSFHATFLSFLPLVASPASTALPATHEPIKPVKKHKKRKNVWRVTRQLLYSLL